jgi:hypothetical protein
MTRRAPLAAVAAAVMLLAACAGSPIVGDESTSPVAPPANEAVTPEPGEQPDLAFGGDCGSVFAEADIEALVGADVTVETEPTGGSALAIDVLGGLTCAWGGGDYAFYVFLTVIPAEGLEATIAEYSYPGGQPDCWGQNKAGGEGACYFSRVVDGYWLAGLFQVETGTGLLPTNGIDGVAALLEERAIDHPATPVAFPAGMWEPMECGTLAAGEAEEVSLGFLGAAPGSMSGGVVGPGMVGAGEAVGDSFCVWSEPNRVTTELMPGAGWAIDRLTDTAPIVVDGAVAAVVQHEVDGSARITATDGVNLAWITAPTEVLSDDKAAAFLAAVMRTAAG